MKLLLPLFCLFASPAAFADQPLNSGAKAVPAAPPEGMIVLTPAYAPYVALPGFLPLPHIPILEKFDLQEVKARSSFQVPRGTANVALHKRVTGSDPLPIIGTLDSITDGDKETNFFQTGAVGLQWVQIDLGAPYAIWKILVWHNFLRPNICYDVNVQLSNDPEFKGGGVVIFNSDHDDSSKLGIGLDPAYMETCYGRVMEAAGVKARYVRLYSNGNTIHPMNEYMEVEVYGTPAK